MTRWLMNPSHLTSAAEQLKNSMRPAPVMATLAGTDSSTVQQQSVMRVTEREATTAHQRQAVKGDSDAGGEPAAIRR